MPNNLIKKVKPKMLIEQLMRDYISLSALEAEVYCFNGKAKIFVIVRYGEKREISVYDEKFNQIDLLFHPDGSNIILNKKADELINQTFYLYNQSSNNENSICEESLKLSTKKILILSEKLAKPFNFVRVDWLISQCKLYFSELTFSPYSGLIKFEKKWNKKLGKWMRLYEFNKNVQIKLPEQILR